MIDLPKEICISDKYDPAMEVQTQEEADEMFGMLVRHSEAWGLTRGKAIEQEKANLGYFAGYCDAETRERVERLFKCKHPFFGAIAEKGPPDPETAFNIGRAIGTAMSKGEEA
ncbi:MAG TPA: hypothetical protein VGO43_09825 [Pyrinomonadaceae bacterium]|nr:hypothetical protein [Pyrinomonadaceae bacterium]